MQWTHNKSKCIASGQCKDFIPIITEKITIKYLYSIIKVLSSTILCVEKIIVDVVYGMNKLLFMVKWLHEIWIDWLKQVLLGQR